jgi:hypothetical protein
MIKFQYPNKPKPSLTTGVKVSCANKRKLYLIYRNNNDSDFKKYYIKYCKILSKIILLAKKMYYNKLLWKSDNKPKATWNIVKTITNKKDNVDNLISMNINDKISSNPQVIANSFNSYFSSVAENLLKKYFHEKNIFNTKDAVSNLRNSFRQSFSTVKLNNITSFEIEKLINSIKSKNSHGYDQISSRILKVSSPYILSP